MSIKKNLSKAIIFLLASTLILTSCAKAPEEPVYHPDSIVKPAEERQDPNSPIEFDYEDVFNNIYLLGKKISFPDTPEDLGRGFSLGDRATVSNAMGGVITGLYYGGEEIAKIGLKDGTVDNYNMKSKLCWIQLERLSKRTDESGVFGFRIGTSLTVEEAIQFFGEPINDISDRTDSANLEYIYENCQLVVRINESKITMIRIIKE